MYIITVDLSGFSFQSHSQITNNYVNIYFHFRALLFTNTSTRAYRACMNFD